jgi:HK97 family phage major capsid protein
LLSLHHFDSRKEIYMLIQELIEKRNKLMADAGALIQKATVTTEDRSNFDRMIADADVLSADITRLKSVEEFNTQQRSTQRPPRAGFGSEDQAEQTKAAQKRAFGQWFRTGQVSAENRSLIKPFNEQRDLAEGSIVSPITGGQVLVPTGFDPVLHQAMKNYGALADAVGQLRTASGNPILVATANDTGNDLSVLGGPSGGNMAVASEVDPTFANTTSNVDTLTSGVIKVSNQLLQDSEFDLDSWIQQAFGTRLARGLNRMVTLGNSSNIAALAPGGTTVTTANSGSVVYLDLVALFGALDAAYVVNANWVMSSATRAYLMGLISTTGQPILQTDVHGQPFNSLFGRDIVISEYMPAIAASAVPIYFGDLKNAYVLRQAGVGIRRLTELYALQDETAFVLFARAGGYNLSPGTYPVKSLTVHA